MSVTRTPRLAEIRRREDEADAKRTAAWIATAMFLAAGGYVAAITWMVWR